MEAEYHRRMERQLLLPQLGEEGQARLRAASVLVAGLGGLGSAAALYLAGAGVGRLGLLDDDVVDISNLNRQLLHAADRVGTPKAESAVRTLHALAPEVELVPIRQRLTDGSADSLISGYDMVLGCFDNLQARYALNAACVRQGKPNVFGAAARFEGQASVFCVPGAPCYRCFFREPPSAPLHDQPVIGVTPGLVGCIMAAEAIKLAAGIGQTLAGRLLLLDVLQMRMRELPLRQDPECPECGRRTDNA